MTKPNTTEIVIVLDRSGSMAGIRKDMEGGFDQFIAEQRKLPNECKVTLAQFDDQYEVVYSQIDLASVPKLHLQPRGGTALFDAVGRTINDVGARLATTPEDERPSQVMFMIITDGNENQSREFVRAKISEMVQHQTDKYSWGFTFLGTNQDAVLAAQQMGISASNTISYVNTSAGVGTLFDTVSDSMSMYRERGISITKGLVSQDSYNTNLANHAATTSSNSVSQPA